MANNATRFDEKFGIVRHPTSGGNIVMKLGNGVLVPDELWNHDDLIFQSVAGASALTDTEVDRSGIDPDSELGQLMRELWGISREEW